MPRMLPIGGSWDPSRWDGPCEVRQLVSDARFQVDTPDGVQFLFATCLKPYWAPVRGKREPFALLCKKAYPVSLKRGGVGRAQGSQGAVV